MGEHTRSAWSGTSTLVALFRGAGAITAATVLSGCFSLVAYRPDEEQVRLRPGQDTLDVLLLGQCIDVRSMREASVEEEPRVDFCLMILSDEPDFESMPRLEPMPYDDSTDDEPALLARGGFVYPDGSPGVFVHVRLSLSAWLADANRSLDKALLEAAAKGNLEDVPADSREGWMARARDGGNWLAVLEDGSLELRFPRIRPESIVHEFLKTAFSPEEASSAVLFGQSPEVRTEADEVVLHWRPNERGRFRFVQRYDDPIPDPDSKLARRARKARNPVRLADVEARLGEP